MSLDKLQFLAVDKPPKYSTIERTAFDFESWRLLNREALVSPDKKTVRAYVCPEKRHGCGKRRVFRISEFVAGDRYAVQLWCMACGRFFVLEAQGDKLILRALAEAVWLQDEAKGARDKMREVARGS